MSKDESSEDLTKIFLKELEKIDKELKICDCNLE